MSSKWFLWKALVVLVVLTVIGLLIAGGMLIHRTGWSQGYRTAGEEGGAAAPYAPYGLGFPGHGSICQLETAR